MHNKDEKNPETVHNLSLTLLIYILEALSQINGKVVWIGTIPRMCEESRSWQQKSLFVNLRYKIISQESETLKADHKSISHRERSYG